MKNINIQTKRINRTIPKTRLSRGGAIPDLLSGATSGMSIGAAFGPPGAAFGPPGAAFGPPGAVVGAVGGAILGGVQHLIGKSQDKKERERLKRLAEQDRIRQQNIDQARDYYNRSPDGYAMHSNFRRGGTPTNNKIKYDYSNPYPYGLTREGDTLYREPIGGHLPPLNKLLPGLHRRTLFMPKYFTSDDLLQEGKDYGWINGGIREFSEEAKNKSKEIVQKHKKNSFQDGGTPNPFASHLAKTKAKQDSVDTVLTDEEIAARYRNRMNIPISSNLDDRATKTSRFSEVIGDKVDDYIDFRRRMEEGGKNYNLGEWNGKGSSTGVTRALDYAGAMVADLPRQLNTGIMYPLDVIGNKNKRRQIGMESVANYPMNPAWGLVSSIAKDFKKTVAPTKERFNTLAYAMQSNEADQVIPTDLINYINPDLIKLVGNRVGLGIAKPITKQAGRAAGSIVEAGRKTNKFGKKIIDKVLPTTKTTKSKNLSSSAWDEFYTPAKEVVKDASTSVKSAVNPTVEVTKQAVTKGVKPASVVRGKTPNLSLEGNPITREQYGRLRAAYDKTGPVNTSFEEWYKTGLENKPTREFIKRVASGKAGFKDGGTVAGLKINPNDASIKTIAPGVKELKAKPGSKHTDGIRAKDSKSNKDILVDNEELIVNFDGRPTIISDDSGKADMMKKELAMGFDPREVSRKYAKDAIQQQISEGRFNVGGTPRLNSSPQGVLGASRGFTNYMNKKIDKYRDSRSKINPSYVDHTNWLAERLNLSPAGASAIAGNIYGESKWGTQHNEIGKPIDRVVPRVGEGLLQWTNTATPRRDIFRKFMEENYGGDYKNMEGQLEFLAREMEGRFDQHWTPDVTNRIGGRMDLNRFRELSEGKIGMHKNARPSPYTDSGYQSYLTDIFKNTYVRPREYANSTKERQDHANLMYNELMKRQTQPLAYHFKDAETYPVRPEVSPITPETDREDLAQVMPKINKKEFKNFPIGKGFQSDVRDRDLSFVNKSIEDLVYPQEDIASVVDPRDRLNKMQGIISGIGVLGNMFSTNRMNKLNRPEPILNKAITIDPRINNELFEAERTRLNRQTGLTRKMIVDNTTNLNTLHARLGNLQGADQAQMGDIQGRQLIDRNRLREDALRLQNQIGISNNAIRNAHEEAVYGDRIQRVENQRALIASSIETALGQIKNKLLQLKDNDSLSAFGASYGVKLNGKESIDDIIRKFKEAGVDMLALNDNLD